MTFFAISLLPIKCVLNIFCLFRMEAKISFEIQGLWASLLRLSDNNLNGAFLSKTFVNLSWKSLNTILKLFSSTTGRELRNSEKATTRSFLIIVGEKLFVSLSLILLHLLTFGLFLSLIITYVKKWSLKSSVLIIPGISLCDKSLVIIWSMMLADVSVTLVGWVINGKKTLTN